MKEIKIIVPDGMNVIESKDENNTTVFRVVSNNQQQQHIKSKEEQMKEFFLPFLNNLELVTNKDKYPYSVFYKQNGKIIFEHYQNEKYNNFFVRYDGVWSVFGEKFNLNYQQTSDFIKGMAESVLNLKGVTPHR